MDYYKKIDDWDIDLQNSELDFQDEMDQLLADLVEARYILLKILAL